MKNTINMYKMAEERVQHYSKICENLRHDIFCIEHPFIARKRKMIFKGYSMNLKNALIIWCFTPVKGKLIKTLRKEYDNNYKELDFWWNRYIERQKEKEEQ